MLVFHPRFAWQIVAVGILLPVLAQADPASGLESDPSPHADCGSLLKNAEASFAKMPDGVEKSAAKQQLAAARTDLAKGDSTSCQRHVKNAVMAMRAK
jgi:hypothetical protein